MTKRQLVRELKAIGNAHGLKVVFMNSKGTSRFQSDKSLIVVNKKQDSTLAQLATSFFHELSHAIQVVEGKHDRYYSHKFEEDPNPLYALKVELYTDKRGKELMKRFYPNLKYTGGYKDDSFHLGFLTGYYSSISNGSENVSSL